MGNSSSSLSGTESKPVSNLFHFMLYSTVHNYLCLGEVHFSLSSVQMLHTYQWHFFPRPSMSFEKEVTLHLLVSTKPSLWYRYSSGQKRIIHLNWNTI